MDYNHIGALIEEHCSGRGGKDAFSPIYAFYFKPVVGFFRRHGFLPEQCKDLAQDVFFKVWRNVCGLREPRSFEGWLFTIAANIRRNAIRSEIAQGGAPLSLDDEDLVMPSRSLTSADSDHPATRLENAERRRLLHLAIGEMPEKMRICNLLRAQDLSYEQIAEVLQVSLQTVRSQLFEGRQRIKRSLGRHGISE